MRKCVVYSITCGHCLEEYVGETERMLGDRAKEHEFQARHHVMKEPWGKHQKERHPMLDVLFRDVKVIATVYDNASRKIRESVEIRDRQPQINISKGYRLLRVLV